MQSQSSAEYALTKSTPFSAAKRSERVTVANDLKRSSCNRSNPLTLPWIKKLAKIDAGTNDSYIITEQTSDEELDEEKKAQETSKVTLSKTNKGDVIDSTDEIGSGLRQGPLPRTMSQPPGIRHPQYVPLCMSSDRQMLERESRRRREYHNRGTCACNSLDRAPPSIPKVNLGMLKRHSSPDNSRTPRRNAAGMTPTFSTHRSSMEKKQVGSPERKLPQKFQNLTPSTTKERQK